MPDRQLTRRAARRPAPLLPVALALAMAGCGQSAPEGGSARVDAQARAADAEAVIGARWRALFADPARVRQAANELGFRVGPYGPATGGGGFAMTGVEQVFPGASSPTHVAARFAADGPAAARIDRITFTFDVVRGGAQPPTRRERDALKVPRRSVQGFLARFGLGTTDPVTRALQDFTDASDRNAAARLTVTTRRAGADRDTVSVAITPA